MKAPARFAVRHPIVEAIQWTGDNEDAVRAFVRSGEDKGDFYEIDPAGRPHLDDPESTGSLLETVHSSWVELRTGDWVVKGVTGLVFRVGADEFAKRYMPAPDVEPQAERFYAGRIESGQVWRHRASRSCIELGAQFGEGWDCRETSDGCTGWVSEQDLRADYELVDTDDGSGS